MDQDLGSVTPGKCADLVFFTDLKDFEVQRVIIDGVVVAEHGVLAAPLAPYAYPDEALHSMHVKDPITQESFAVCAPREGAVKVRAIQVIGGSAANREAVVELRATDGTVEADVDQDVLKIAVFERHHATGHRALGFVKGFGIRQGAMASTVAHDAHNLMVVGSHDADMALAANVLLQSEGGMCVVRDGKIVGHVALPVAGLMSEQPAQEMARLVDDLGKAWEEIGCTLPSPFMTMALSSLACIPELRLTDKGLVDCRSFEFADLFVE